MTRYALRRHGSDENVGPTHATATEAHMAILRAHLDDLELHVVPVEDDPREAMARSFGYATFREFGDAMVAPSAIITGLPLSDASVSRYRYDPKHPMPAISYVVEVVADGPAAHSWSVGPDGYPARDALPTRDPEEDA